MICGSIGRTWPLDCRMDGGDLLGENSLETAVILSLFCDAWGARDDDVIPDGTGNKRGCGRIPLRLWPPRP